jgi:hypothetical protein
VCFGQQRPRGFGGIGQGLCERLHPASEDGEFIDSHQARGQPSGCEVPRNRAWIVGPDLMNGYVEILVTLSTGERPSVVVRIIT